MANSINYDNFPSILHYMGHDYMGGMIQGSNGINITQAQYDALSTADKMNGKIYMIIAEEGQFVYHIVENGTLIVREDTVNDEVLWFFNGYEKTGDDIAPPQELAQFVPSTLLLELSCENGENQITNGWIGFYNGNIRSWSKDISWVVSGTFYGIINTNWADSSQHIVPYYNPIIPESGVYKIYHMGTEYNI